MYPGQVIHTSDAIRIKFNPGVSERRRLQHMAKLLGNVASAGAKNPMVQQMANQIRQFPPTKGLAQTFHKSAAWGLRDRGMRTTALDIVRNNVQEHDEMGEIQAIGAWVAENIRYTADPHLVEYFQMPDRTLKDRAGDCDDMVSLACALGSAIGYPTAAVIVNAGGGQYFNHVMWGARPYSLGTDKYIPFELTKGPRNLNPGSIGTATKSIVIRVK